VSSAGKQWQVASYPKGDVTDVQYLNGKFFAVTSSGVVLVSTNGLDWAAKATLFGNLRAITYGDSGYAAVGFGNAVLKSSDGDSWTRTTPVEEPGNIDFYGVAAGKGGYVATGIGGIFRSTDAVTWKNVSPTGVTYMSRVAFGSGRFVAVGYNANVYGSDDGITWAPLNIPGVFSGSDVVYGNGRFVLTPGNGDILTSADGIHWQTTASGVIGHSLRFGNGQYFLIADNSVAASPDAITWTTVYSKTDVAYPLMAMAASAGRYVVVGFSCRARPVGATDRRRRHERHLGCRWRWCWREDSEEQRRAQLDPRQHGDPQSPQHHARQWEVRGRWGGQDRVERRWRSVDGRQP
jgi:hypothetical protein